MRRAAPAPVPLAPLLLVLSLLAPAAAGTAADRVSVVEFRDLFAAGGKPSPHATALDGRTVAIQGFLAPPPAKDSPFRVLVGAPTTHCPYCTAVNESAHLPYVLVYPGEGAEVPKGGRLIVIGTLDSGHAHEETYGLHYDLRVTDAVLLPASVLGGQRAAPASGRAAKAGASEIVAPHGASEIDEE